MKLNLLSIAFLLLLNQFIHAQCPPPGTPTSTNTCPEAQPNCLSIDGYCGTINNNNQQSAFPGCPNNVLNNDEWFAFYAGSTQISIQITPSNCATGGQQGLQGAIYSGCITSPLALQCNCTTNAFVLSSPSFVVGQIYWIVIDGCMGNVCDYAIDVISGTTVGQPPADPGPISGPTNVLLNTTTTYTVPPIAGATTYQWTLSPTLGGFNSNTNSVNVTWTLPGVAQLCVTSSNVCFSNPTPSCIEITVTSQPPPPNDDCGNAISIACGQTIAGTTQYATADAATAPSCTGTTFPGVWYSFTGTGNNATLNTCSGASFNTKISVYTGGCGGLSCVVGNDDFCGNLSQMAFLTNSGTTYFVLVHGANGATGTFNLSLSCTAPMPPNGAGTVSCPSLAVVPTPPAYTSPNCVSNGPITPTGPTIVNNPNPLACEGTITYTWTYTDCIGMSLNWSFVYTIERLPFGNMPTNGAATVACPAQATQPVPPTVLDHCGAAITPTGPVVVNNPAPVTCVGTRTYTWTYTDCEGNSQSWVFVYTIGPPTFTAPQNGSALVDCPDDTDIQPVPPTVNNSCSIAVVPQLIGVSPKNDCEGQRTYTFRYTHCDNTFSDWLFIYTIEYLDFSVPPSDTIIADCPSSVIVPTPPMVEDNCGIVLTPTGPEITSTNLPGGCETSIQYAWTYTDCEGNSHVWSRTYVFDSLGNFAPPPNEEIEIDCGFYAQPPFPQTLFDDCGREIMPTGPIISGDTLNTGCFGSRTYTYHYTACNGIIYPWSFTYLIVNNDPPVGQCAGSSASFPSIDVKNLTCMEELPCPTTYDFSQKMEELIEVGGFYDVCSGDTLHVELDSWSGLWECSAANSDSTYTFGRTFYFKISDPCGNAFPSLCSVTYSGECLPLETFPQAEWGIIEGEPGTAVNPEVMDIDLIQGLLDLAPFFIGDVNRSITITDAQCVVDLLPGVGFSKPLSNCHEINCAGCNPKGISSIKNSLAGNTIALMLNMRFNEKYNDLPMMRIRQQGLDCIVIEPTIVHCMNGVENCILRVVESNGTIHDFPYTIGGLLDLSNLYLNGGLVLGFTQTFNVARAIDFAIANVNDYWHSNNPIQVYCDTEPSNANPIPQSLNHGYGQSFKSPQIELKLVPNPASNQVNLQISHSVADSEVSFVLLNSFGQKIMQKPFGKVKDVNEWIDLSGIPGGIYFIDVKVGEEQTVQRLVILPNR